MDILKASSMRSEFIVMDGLELKENSYLSKLFLLG